MDELLKESHKKRSMFFLNELTAYALSRVRFALPLCGFVGGQLTESSDTFNDTDQEPLKRETALGKCIKEMKAVSDEVLRQNLGHVEHAFSPLDEGKPAVLSNYFEPGDDSYMDAIDDLRHTGKSSEASLALIGTYYFLLANFYWPEPIEAEIKKGLELMSGKSWREVATVLFDHARELADKFGGPDDEEEEDEDDEEENGEYEEEDEA
jgi:hypothetical protein